MWNLLCMKYRKSHADNILLIRNISRKTGFVHQMSHEILKNLTLKDDSLTTLSQREKTVCALYNFKWRKTNYDIPNSCINLGMSKSNCLHKHYSRPLCHLENTGNHLCYYWSYSYYKVTKHFLQSIWNLGDFCHFYCLE